MWILDSLRGTTSSVIPITLDSRWRGMPCHTIDEQGLVCNLPQHPPSYPHIARTEGSQQLITLWWEDATYCPPSMIPEDIPSPGDHPYMGREYCGKRVPGHSYRCSLPAHPLGFPHVAYNSRRVVGIWLEGERYGDVDRETPSMAEFF